MGFSDADFISKEKHELDYVLRKWEKRTTQANRDILANALDVFRKDKANSPFTRDIFYQWAERTGLKTKFEARDAALSQDEIQTEEIKKEVTEVLQAEQKNQENKQQTDNTENKKKVAEEIKQSQNNTQKTEKLVQDQKTNQENTQFQKQSSGPAKKRRPWWKWIFIAILLIAVILLIVFLMRGCSKTSDNNANTDSGKPGNIITAVKKDKILTQKDLPQAALTLRFKANSASLLMQGEEDKLIALIKTLNAFDSGILVLSGWCANFGDPSLNQPFSQKRADYIKQRISQAGIPSGITLKAIGRGAVTAKGQDDFASSRQVEVSVE